MPVIVKINNYLVSMALCLVASLAALFFFSTQASAIDVSEETSAGFDMFVQSASLLGESGGTEDKDAPWNYSFDYAYTRSTDTTTGIPIVDNTSDFTLNGSWLGPSGWGQALSLSLSNTPDENLVSQGGIYNPSYRWNFGSEDDEVRPYFETRLDIGSINYLESFNGQVRVKKILKPSSGTAELRQSMYGINFAHKPNRRWKITIGADRYAYNRDVDTFENQLDSARAALRGIGGFSNTVGGLARFSYSGSAQYRFNDDWRATLSETVSIIAADNSISTATKLKANYQANSHFTMIVGTEYDNSVSFKVLMGIFGLEVDTQ